MLMESSLLIGRHFRTTTTNDFTTAPKSAKQAGCTMLQIFLSDPQQTVAKARPESELVIFGTELKSLNLKLVIHGSYTINFCHGFDSSRFRTSTKSLVKELESSAMIGPDSLGVVIHMGKNVNKLPESEAIDNYTLGLKTVIAKTSDLPDELIILETGAGVGTEVGTQMDKLSEIYHKLNEKEKTRIGFCIDTCHIWSAGYDISTKKGVRNFFALFDKLIGVDKIVCFHLNNSVCDLGSRRDHHADLLTGTINPEGLAEVVRFAHKHKIPIITETPLNTVNTKTNDDIEFNDELTTIKQWIAK